MKKIIVITSVKNECDIIESYCRYNLTFCDAVLLYENHKSSDNTRSVIQKLIDEGLPVYFEAENKDIYYEFAKNKLAKTAFEIFNAEIVLQLDADEFLLPDPDVNKKNLREILESLDERIEYQIPWRTYIYTEEPANGTPFNPRLFKYYRNPALEEAQGHMGKTILSRYLYTEKKALFTQGAHRLEYTDSNIAAAEVKISDALLCAHYPIRSREQVLKKAIPNWINKWTLPEHLRHPRQVLSAFQLGLLFDSIKEHGDILPEVMNDISIRYSLYNMNECDVIDRLIKDLGENVIIKGVPDASFYTEPISLRYTDIPDNKTLLKAMLTKIDETLQHLDNESRAKTAALEEIYSSGTWKAAQLLTRIYRFFTPWKNTEI